MLYGTVKSWEASKGFGFIESDDEDDFFVHAHDLDASLPGGKLTPGQRVSFDVSQEMKGDRAINVKLAR